MEKINCNDIAILMATYNGEKYLVEQIDSILAQTRQDWHLYFHDDGSKDNTVAIIKKYIKKYPQRMTLLKYPSQGGACRNFLSMLERIDAPYYMFCDQDDVWLPEKTKIEMTTMRKAEISNKGFPIIVNTDLTVVDAEKNIIHSSFWKYENIYPDFAKCFFDYAALNVVTGCTMLFNHKVKEIMQKPYDKALMHDAWITLYTIANKGILCNVREATILYRQHGQNTLGARNATMLTWKYRLGNLKEILKLNISHYRQMKAIAKISILEYIYAKIRYRKYLQKQEK